MHLPKSCGTCNQTFDTTPVLLQHCLADRHQLDRVCGTCSRFFKTTAGCSDHKAALHNPGPTRRIGDAPQLVTTPVDLADTLAQACHTSATLQRSGYQLEESRDNWKYRDHRLAPKPDRQNPKRPAVVIDCEMVRVRGRYNELVELVVVDFDSGEVLIDTLVKPDDRVTDWRSGCHGITPTSLSVAVATNQALQGWRAARNELWQNIDQNTIVVGQSVNHDLDVLRTVHIKIVDTAILTAEAVFGEGQRLYRKWGLQVLCHELLHVAIRSGHGLHDCLEDAHATRSIALWCLRNDAPLQEWAAGKLKDHLRDNARKRARQKRLQAKRTTERQVLEQALQQLTIGGGQYEGNLQHPIQPTWDERETLRWEDVIDYDTWPKSPPDSD